MKKLSFLTTCLFIVISSQAQSDPVSLKKNKFFIASIKTMNNEVLKGKLYNINDNEVVLAKSLNDHEAIAAENIRSISFKSKNSVLKGALIGAGMAAPVGYWELVWNFIVVNAHSELPAAYIKGKCLIRPALHSFSHPNIRYS